MVLWLCTQRLALSFFFLPASFASFSSLSLSLSLLPSPPPPPSSLPPLFFLITQLVEMQWLVVNMLDA